MFALSTKQLWFVCNSKRVRCVYDIKKFFTDSEFVLGKSQSAGSNWSNGFR